VRDDDEELSIDSCYNVDLIVEERVNEELKFDASAVDSLEKEI
jgi:hypothetical protein